MCHLLSGCIYIMFNMINICKILQLNNGMLSFLHADAPVMDRTGNAIVPGCRAEEATERLIHQLMKVCSNLQLQLRALGKTFTKVIGFRPRKGCT